VCNACGLYWKLHKRPRPVNLKTKSIRKRNRRHRYLRPAEAPNFVREPNSDHFPFVSRNTSQNDKLNQRHIPENFYEGGYFTNSLYNSFLLNNINSYASGNNSINISQPYIKAYNSFNFSGHTGLTQFKTQEGIASFVGNFNIPHNTPHYNLK
jgi:hypothetical protein